MFASNEKALPAKKYCRFRKAGIHYIDYKNPDFLLKFLNEQGKIKESPSFGFSALRSRWFKVKITFD